MSFYLIAKYFFFTMEDFALSYGRVCCKSWFLETCIAMYICPVSSQAQFGVLGRDTSGGAGMLRAGVTFEIFLPQPRAGVSRQKEPGDGGGSLRP